MCVGGAGGRSWGSTLSGMLSTQGVVVLAQAVT